MFNTSAATLITAFILDTIIGDPEKFPHPIRLMGNAISFFEPVFRKLPTGLIISGSFFTLFLVSVTYSLSLILLLIFTWVHPVLGAVFNIVLVFYALSANSLAKAGREIGKTLIAEGIPAARKKLAYIVGRDVNKLDEDGIVRATVETVSENLVDGVISPLLFAAIGGGPMAMVFKMVNTLDSMVGYKNDKYLEFGKFSAKTDDLFNYIPARISMFIICLAAQLVLRKGKEALKTSIAEGDKHSSPNAGIPEAAFAGALGIKLGGPGYYGEKLVEKSYIGKNLGRAVKEDIEKACKLMFASSVISVSLIYVVLMLI